MVSAMLIKFRDGPKFSWNIDGDVGLGSANKTDDVQLVQLGYSVLAQSVRQPADLRAVCAQVKPGAVCTGREDDPLVKAIRAHQATFVGTRDGRVSVVKTSNALYVDAGGPHAYLLLRLLNNVFDAQPGDFPRIDKLPACPAALRAVVVASCFR